MSATVALCDLSGTGDCAGRELPGGVLHRTGGAGSATATGRWVQGSRRADRAQAARLQVYGLDKSGKVVAQVTPDIDQVEWRVRLANRKAAWYQFLSAMDLGARYAKTAGRRDSAIAGTTRKGLVIDPGPVPPRVRRRRGRSTTSTPESSWVSRCPG